MLLQGHQQVNNFVEAGDGVRWGLDVCVSEAQRKHPEFEAKSGRIIEI